MQRGTGRPSTIATSRANVLLQNHGLTNPRPAESVTHNRAAHNDTRCQTDIKGKQLNASWDHAYLQSLLGF